MVHDVGLVEELAQDALVAALQHWPGEGVQRIPGAWLMTSPSGAPWTGSAASSGSTSDTNRFDRELETRQSVREFDDAMPDHIEDDLLRPMFVACHPG